MNSFSQIAKLTSAQLNEKTALYVWITNINKKASSLWFITGQDSSGYIQIVVKNQGLISRLKAIKKGDLLEVYGIIKLKSPKKNAKKTELEIELTDYQLINAHIFTKLLPFDLHDNLNEETKYRYRYLDLRRPPSQHPLLLKNQFCYELRKFFHERGFVDIETPLLANSSPEGAQCFVVPSNLKNRYYTLPQSAQIFKQLLMISGFDKYYQIAKSFRQEDARSNRQIEFSQLELEMSFTTAWQLRQLVEEMLQTILKKVFACHLEIPFPSLTYQEAIQKKGTDKPDLRHSPQDVKELKFCWITDWPLFEYNEDTKKYTSGRHPFTLPQSKYIEPFLHNKIEPQNIIGEAFDLVCNGEEILSGSLRIYTRPLQEKVLEVLGYNSQAREKHFGYFLQALSCAAPPHGGFGLGIDRLLAVLLGLKSLKEVLAFPKNVDGSCSLTGTPDYLAEK